MEAYYNILERLLHSGNTYHMKLKSMIHDNDSM